MNPIARIETCYQEKFGIPRQSGLVKNPARVVFTQEYRNPDIVRGLESFSHIWLIWLFSEHLEAGWSPTVRPPRLGGNKRMGVLATRSPFRPNPIGLSAVRLERIESSPECGPILHISGADLMDDTPIIDIKPYIPYADSIPDALPGFASNAPCASLQVNIPEREQTKLTPDELRILTETLSLDPRPSYQSDPARIYGINIMNHNVKFKIEGDLLTVVTITPLKHHD